MLAQFVGVGGGHRQRDARARAAGATTPCCRAAAAARRSCPAPGRSARRSSRGTRRRGCRRRAARRAARAWCCRRCSACTAHRDCCAGRDAGCAPARACRAPCTALATVRDVARQAREFRVEEADVEGRVVDDELGAADERHQLVDDLGELRRLLQPRGVDAVHGQRAGVDLAFGIQVAMELLAGRAGDSAFPRSRFR